MRLTHALNAEGITFDREKIAEIEREKERQVEEAFLRRAREHWKGGG